MARNDSGMDQFQRSVAKIVKELDPKVTDAIEAALVPVIAEARSLVHDVSHDLANSIHTERDIEGVYLVGGDRTAWYGHLVEYGHVERVWAGQGQAKRLDNRLPVPPHPFLTPPFEASRESIINAAELAVARLVNG